ncbi:GTP-binding protein [Heyndrickxia sporothermodurans]|uniref:GTP-binding protein n=1 Tax=Heyndrickxia sporothermodurans TaxID=46224 RepID=UPI0013FDBB39|nr:GTP-binding protein [Heyndrickxia sporothermodurans]
MRREWDPVYGDRKTELVLIGIDMDKVGITKALDRCLLTTEEQMGNWSELVDPFEWLVTEQRH